VTFHQMILSYTQLGVLEEIEFRHQLPDDIYSTNVSAQHDWKKNIQYRKLSIDIPSEHSS
jgi:hypothetical protein